MKSDELKPYRFPPLMSADYLAEEYVAPPLPVDNDSLLDEAKQAGFQQGLIEGRAKGIEQGFAEGRQQGYDEGHATGLTTSKTLFEEASLPIDTLMQTLNDFYARAEHQQREATLALVTRIAGLVIQQEIATRPELLLSWIDDKLAQEQLQGSAFSVRVCEADFQAIETLAPEKVAEWRLLAQAHLTRGECIIDTEQQHFDLGCQQRLDTCLSTLAQSLNTSDPVA